MTTPLRTLIAFALFLCAQAAAAGAETAATQPEAVQSQPEAQKRVILRVNRNLDIPGYVLAEDDENIRIRDPKGQEHGYNKSRVTQIVRLADPRPGQSGVVHLRNGQTREGVIIEDAFGHVVIEIQSIRTRLKRDAVDHVVLLPTFEELYAKFKGAVKPGMYDAHLRLCEWIVSQRRYDIAARELQELLDQRETAAARHLMNVVQAELELHPEPAAGSAAADASSASETTPGVEEEGRNTSKVPEVIAAATQPAESEATAVAPQTTAPGDEPVPGEPAQPAEAPELLPAEIQPDHGTSEEAGAAQSTEQPLTLDAPEAEEEAAEADEGEGERKTGPVTDADILPKNVITSEDVNIIRMYEIDFEKPPKVAVSSDVIRELLEKYGSSELVPASQTDRNALFRADPIQIVRLMFALRARDLYSKVRVLSEPQSLLLFKQRVHDTWLINSCASSRCHGGVNAGRFYINRRNYKDERVRYSNLLTLERLKLDAEWPLINFDDPEKSLIIQYGLPRNAARKPHPNVPNWKPVFSPTSDRLRTGTIEWINSMFQPRPNYGVEFEPVMLEPRRSEGEGDSPSR